MPAADAALSYAVAGLPLPTGVWRRATDRHNPTAGALVSVAWVDVGRLCLSVTAPEPPQA